MKTKLQYEVENEAAWSAIIPDLWQVAKGRKIWLLIGDLGTGKTTLVRCLNAYLGGLDEVTSPTFSLINEYTCESKAGRSRIYHLDLYRLESIEEVIDIGLEEILEGEDLILIEWPELAIPLISSDYFEIEIQHINSHRKILVL